MFDSVAEAPGSRAANATELRVKTQSLPGVSVVVGNKMPSQSNQRTDDSFPQHDKYFFRDGNITFLVDGIIYCVHRYFFSRDSTYFSNRFALLGIYDHQALPTIVSLGDIERRDFDAFLSVLYPEDFEEYDLSYEQWRSVLHLSTHWGFTSLRKLALRSIKPPTSYDHSYLRAPIQSTTGYFLP
ncbi:hypothetical protein B0F90DRAFT_1816527 [Multifurca ochricompacta]|uniref:BTB domain-containing protein n=1 Tax=Multifurca ochricompacta TaxID=376703 RepID=A0AAD4M5Q8_9AGAM|nr:hypothetical protein B0F90DRAFT_1816527 [Multifurca ochricompacta]